MSTLISIVIIAAAVLLILVVLVQNSKGGGLDSSFAGANQLGGAAQSTETIEKATWTLAGGIAILSIAATMFIGKPNAVSAETQIKGVSTGVPASNTGVPSMPAPTPGAPGK